MVSFFVGLFAGMFFAGLYVAISYEERMKRLKVAYIVALVRARRAEMKQGEEKNEEA